MFNFIFRVFWRFLIFTIGGIAIYFGIFYIYPYADLRLPTFIVLLLFYCLAAYVVIPTLVRLFRLVIKPDHLPIYATSGDGWSSDPVNIIIVSKNKTHLVRTMTKAGWHRADKLTVRTTIRFAYAMALGRSYRNAPFSNLYLFGRKHDIGFQIQTGENPSPRHRHHIRFWQLTTSEKTKTTEDNFWRTTLHLFSRKERQIWVGTATHDVAPFAFRIQNLQLTHQIDPDTNLERDYVIATLREKKLIKHIETVPTGEPLSFRGQTFGVRIVVDGFVKVVRLK
jgi:hypothetical protein